MKLKKILMSLIAAAAIVSTTAATVSAVYDGEATYCFDNDSRLSDLETYGSVTETGFKITQTTNQAKNGNGCIVISENISDEVSDKSGGVYVEAGSVGIDSFDGCTITMSVLACEGAEKICDSFSLFSDGMLWLNASASDLSTTEWKDITLVIPEGAKNDRVGFTIPTFSKYMGDLIYIDDFTITLPDGNVVANVGDYQPKTVTEAETVSKGVNIALIIVLVVLVLAIVGGIGFLISTAMKRFS